MTHSEIDLPTLLHQRGFRLTPQRQIILDTLCEMGGHVTAAELFERIHGRFPAIDRSTVYRALATFVEMKVVCASDIAGITIFEVAANDRDHSGPHHHLVCRDCGHIDHVADEAFYEFAGRLRDNYGFDACLDSLNIEGICRACGQLAGPEQASDAGVIEPVARID